MQMKLLFVLCEKRQARQGRIDERGLKPLFCRLVIQVGLEAEMEEEGKFLDGGGFCENRITR